MVLLREYRFRFRSAPSNDKEVEDEDGNQIKRRMGRMERGGWEGTLAPAPDPISPQVECKGE